MADPTALPPSLLEKVLDPNNLVAVVTRWPPLYVMDVHE